MKIKKFPNKISSPNSDDCPYKLSTKAPERPNITPSTFNPVMRSFNMIADNIKTIIGTVIMITDPLMGVVY